MSITLQRVVVTSEHPRINNWIKEEFSQTTPTPQHQRLKHRFPTKKNVHPTAQKPNTATVKETNFRFIGGALGSASFLTALPPSVPLAAGVHGEMTTWQFANPPQKMDDWTVLHMFSIEKNSTVHNICLDSELDHGTMSKCTAPTNPQISVFPPGFNDVSPGLGLGLYLYIIK